MALYHLYQSVVRKTELDSVTLCVYLQVMWPWQPPTSSTHPHYPSSSLSYHHPHPSHISPDSLPTGLPPSQFQPVVGGQHYLYPNPPGEFPFSQHLSEHVPVDQWAESRQASVQPSDSLPFSSPLQPRPHLPSLHPSQQATPTNVQPQQLSPIPLTPSHPPPTHTVTQSPFSMDFILREQAPPTAEGVELTQQFPPTGGRPSQTDLSDPVVAPGYQSGMGEVMYQTPPQPHPLPHPHTPSPQLQQSIKPVNFNPSGHYGDQSKTPMSAFGGVAGSAEGVAQFSPTHNTPSFPDNLQPFQLHSNYRPPDSGEKVELGGGASEAPYSPPQLIPGTSQSGELQQSHDLHTTEDHSCPPPMDGEVPNSTENLPLLPFDGSPLAPTDHAKPDHSDTPTAVKPHPLTPPTPGTRGLQIDEKEGSDPGILPLQRSPSPPGDDLDIRPSAPRPPPLVRRGRGSSDEEDDVFLPPPAPLQPPLPDHTPSPPPISGRGNEEDEPDKTTTETVATTPSE